MDWGNTGKQLRGLKPTGTNRVSHGGTAVSNEDTGEFPRGLQRTATVSFKNPSAERHACDDVSRKLLDC